VETRLEQCALCGAQIDLATGGCPYCLPAPGSEAAIGAKPALATAPSEPPRATTHETDVPLAFEDSPLALASHASPAKPSVTPAASRATPPPLSARLSEAPLTAPAPAVSVPSPPAPEAPTAARPAGPIAFEAEECLARGDADRALVLASKALKERPDNLTLRALYERARRATLRGRRRDQLEQRVRDAQALAERGEVAQAERIVTSALKLIPDHEAALALFAQLKEQRLQAHTAEAEAERELDSIARNQAQQALGRARTLHANGNERSAFVAVRRGLRFVPDEPALLALYGELQEGLARAAALHASLRGRVLEARALLAQGSIEKSRDVLRSVLREDPDFAPAQVAIQEVRTAFLARSAPPPATVATVAAPVTAPLLAASSAPAPQPAPSRSQRGPAAQVSRAAIPPEVMLPRGRRRLPLALTLAGGAGLSLLVLFAASRLLVPARPPATPVAAVLPSAEPRAASGSPLDAAEPELRRAVERTLSAYAAALERGDDDALAQARPDLSPQERERALGPFRGALNAAVDLRVQSMHVAGDVAEVQVQKTDVVVDGQAPPASVEETLRFRRSGGAWILG